MCIGDTYLYILKYNIIINYIHITIKENYYIYNVIYRHLYNIGNVYYVFFINSDGYFSYLKKKKIIN